MSSRPSMPSEKAREFWPSAVRRDESEREQRRAAEFERRHHVGGAQRPVDGRVAKRDQQVPRGQQQHQADRCIVGHDGVAAAVAVWRIAGSN